MVNISFASDASGMFEPGYLLNVRKASLQGWVRVYQNDLRIGAVGVVKLKDGGLVAFIIA